MIEVALVVHLLAVFAAIGGALGQAVLLAQARKSVDPDRAGALRLAAFEPTRLLEAPGMVVAVVSGAALSHLQHPPHGWVMGLKLVCVAWLALAAVLELRATRTIAAYATASGGSELEARRACERQLDRMGKVSALAMVAVVALSVSL